MRLPISPPARSAMRKSTPTEVKTQILAAKSAVFRTIQAQAVSFLMRNAAAYMAGKASRVSTVATIRPPMMATAMGPQNTLRDSGIMASTAAAAVNTMGRSLCTAASTIASQADTPRARPLSIWSIRITELR